MFDSLKILPVGTVLRSDTRTYTIVEVLGQGGFGITYRATAVVKVDNIEAEAQFAIKEHFVDNYCERGANYAVSYSRPVANEVEKTRKSFLSEARRLRDLCKGKKCHPNIVCVNETFEANNTAYFVMEYLKGESLMDYVYNHGALSNDEMRRIMIPIIDAVGFLHREYITHLDIKPANIMLTRNKAGRLRPVLIDFGLSRHFDPVTGEPSSTLHQAGFSPGYAPIEQVEAFTHFYPGTDVYSLGATMLFALTGHTPDSAADTDHEVLRRAIPAGLPGSTVAAITEAMRYVRKERPANADALLAVLTEDDCDLPLYDDEIKPEIYEPTRKPVPTSIPTFKPTLQPKHVSKPKSKRGLYIGIAVFVLLAVLCAGWMTNGFGLLGEARPKEEAKEEAKTEVPTPAPVHEVTNPEAEEGSTSTPSPEETRPEETVPAEEPEHEDSKAEKPAQAPGESKTEETTPAPKTKNKPTPTPKTKNKPTPAPSPKEKPKHETEKATAKYHTTPRHLDLAVRYNGKRCYFSSKEWAKLSYDQKSEYSITGMVVSAKGQRFIVELYDRGSMQWDKAMEKYRNVMPTKAQGDALASVGWETWQSKMNAYGGSATSGFWTKDEYNSTSAWLVYITTGVTYHTYKTKAYNVRAVIKL